MAGKKCVVLMLSLIFSFAVLAADANLPAVDSNALYKNPNIPVEDRIKDLLPRMTLEEKIGILGGDIKTHFDTVPNKRLGIPMFSMGDGPHGLRWTSPTTCFPTSVAMAATWDPNLIEKIGVALGKEWLAKNRNVLLGPCINIQRIPHGGRNFESFSEDPYLISKMTVAYVKGVQSQNVVAVPKHFAANNQEWNRRDVDVIVSERALNEIYFPAFKAAVQEGGAWSIMSAYNKINGDYCGENQILLTDILKNQWGFKGIVMTDWVSIHDTVKSAKAGLDLEMPYGDYFGHKLLDAVKAGQVSEELINDKTTRILRVMFAAGMFDQKAKPNGSDIESNENKAVALDTARASIVLLKNEKNLLPINKAKVKKIAVIGPNAKIGQLGGWGSSMVTSTHTVSPYEGIINKAGQNIEILYAEGCDIQKNGEFTTIPMNCFTPADANLGKFGLKAEYFNNNQLAGNPAFTRIDPHVDFDWGMLDHAYNIKSDIFSARWTGKLTPPVSGKYKISSTTYGGCRFFIDGKQLIDRWQQGGTENHIFEIELEAGRQYDFRYEFIASWGGPMVKVGWQLPNYDNLANAAAVASKADVAIVCVGYDDRFEGEGHDKEVLFLPGQQINLIKAVAAANKNTVVVYVGGSPITMQGWVDKVPSIVAAWYGGLNGGIAVADVLFGDVNPSGKLPCTFPKTWEDCPAFGTYPGEREKAEYKEGIYVGYRYFDTKEVEPLFCFGHGLSYTKFKYSDMKINPKSINADGKVTVTVKVTNTGKVAGAEVVQLYIRDIQSSLDRPLQELKGFQKVYLQPKESKTVSFELNKDALSFYDPASHKWIAEPGKFEIRIGSSSRDIRLKGEFELKK